MNEVIKHIRIDLYNPKVYEVIKAEQGDDKSRCVEFELYDQGNPYEITNDTIANVEGLRADGSGYIKSCEINNNIITFVLDDNLLYYDGVAKLKLVLYSDNKKVLSSIPFKVSIERNPMFNIKFKKDEYSLINDVLNMVGEMDSKVSYTDKSIADINDNLSSEISRAKEADEILKSRVDVITSLPEGSTTGDAELQDIRVKADGTTATSAGNAVREQISELKSDLVNYVPMYGLKQIIDLDVNYEKNLTEDILKFTGKIYDVRNGVLLENDTTDSNVINSGIIPIRYIKEFSSLGSYHYNCLTMAFFKTSDPTSIVANKTLFGDSSKLVSPGWYRDDVVIDELELDNDINYVLLQMNKNPVLTALTTPLFSVSYIMESKDINNINNINNVLDIVDGVDNINTNSFLKFSGKLYNGRNAINIVDTTDIDVINSGFISLDDIDYFEGIGSYANNFPLAMFFTDKDLSTYQESYTRYGDGTMQISDTWYEEKIRFSELNLPSSIKYVILQSNRNVDLIEISGELLTTARIVESKTLLSTEKVYNVKNYGATGNGINDDTNAIQKAINDCYENGGGIVYLPNGKYKLDTVTTRNNITSHLFIPMNERIDTRCSIRIIGESSVMYPSFYVDFGYANKNSKFYGTTLLSTYIPNEDVLTTPISILSSEHANNFTGCNFTRVQIEHMNFVTSIDDDNYPKVSGINASHLATVSIKDVTVGTNKIFTSLVDSPTNHVCFGIAMPRRYCDPNQLLEEICVSGGYKYGIICTEHVNGINVQLQNCLNGFVFARTDHPNYFSLCSIHGSKNQVVSLDNAFGEYEIGKGIFKFDLLDIEKNSDQVPTAFNYSNGVVDPSNNLHGEITYFMVPTDSWSQIGGEHLTIHSMN